MRMIGGFKLTTDLNKTKTKLSNKVKLSQSKSGHPVFQIRILNR